MKKIAIALLLLVSTITFGQEKVLLRLNYEKGDVYEVNASVNQDMGGLMKMGINMSMQLKVTDVKEETYITEASFNGVKMDMETMGQKMKYDSNMKESEMDDFAKSAHGEMKELLETRIAFEYDKLGKIIEASLLSKKGNAKDFEDNMNSMVLPKEAVQVGSKWSEERSTKAGLKMNYEYEVTEITKDKVEVKVTGTISGEKDAISGVGSIDRKTGNMIKMDMDLIITVQGQKVNSKVIVTTTKK